MMSSLQFNALGLVMCHDHINCDRDNIGNENCNIVCNLTDMCSQTADATTHLELAGMLQAHPCVHTSFWLSPWAPFPFCRIRVYYSDRLKLHKRPDWFDWTQCKYCRTEHKLLNRSERNFEQVFSFFLGDKMSVWHDFGSLLEPTRCLCLFIGWSLEFLQYLRLRWCLSDYNRSETMAILSDNNRWKYSCREVCAQMSHMRKCERRGSAEENGSFSKHHGCHFFCF